MSNPNVPVSSAPVEAVATPNAEAEVQLTDIEKTPLDKITPDIARQITAAKEAREREAKLKKVDKVASKQSQVDAPKEKAEPVSEAAKEVMRKYKLKVDGQDVEVDEEELKRGYSHQKAASKILNEGKAARKQAEEFVSMMKDPARLMEAITKLGHDPRKLAEEYLVSQLQDEQMDPRDKELRDAKARIKAIEDMENQKKEAIEKQRDEQLKAKYAADYTQQFVGALEKTGLPPTKPMVAEMAKYIRLSAKDGWKMTPDEAAMLVKQDIQMAHSRLIGDSDGETLMKLLGEEVANKVRKYDMAKLRDPNAGLKTPDTQTKRERQSQDVNKPASIAEQRKNWKKFNR